MKKLGKMSMDGMNMGDWLDAQIDAELRGKNLACFCPLDRPCHADILLELAND